MRQTSKRLSLLALLNRSFLKSYLLWHWRRRGDQLFTTTLDLKNRVPRHISQKVWERESITYVTTPLVFQQIKREWTSFSSSGLTANDSSLSHGRLWMRRWRMDASNEGWRQQGTMWNRFSIHCVSWSTTLEIFFLFNYSPRVPFTMILVTGVIKLNTTLLEGRLDSTHKRPSCPLTGTHPSPRPASVWRSVDRSVGLIMKKSFPHDKFKSSAVK